MSWITDAAVWDGLPVVPVAVTINQASGQTDPGYGSSVLFDVVFAEAVTGFATGDVTLSGTAGATTGTVSGSGTTYLVTVTGMTTGGTVIATIAAGVCVAVSDGRPNAASTSTDNTVTWVALPVASMWCWYDASNAGSITSSGGRVSQWNDISGSNRHLVQATAGNKPFTGSRTQNSKNVLDFQAGQFMRYTAAMNMGMGEWSLYIAMAKDTGSGGNRGFFVVNNGSGNDYDNANSFAIEETTGATPIGCAMSNVTRTLTGSATWFGTQAFIKSTTASNLFDMFGRTPTAVTNTTFIIASGVANGGIVVGTRFISGAPSTHYMDGAIAEILFYNVAHGSGDRAAVIAYLTGKWGN